jgi:hypothetical protein
MQSVSSIRWVLAAVFFSLAATMPAVATVQTYGLDPTRYGTGGWGVCPAGSPYGTAIAVLGNSTYFQNFGDTLPAGSKITHIRINLPMSLGSFSSLHSDVSVTVDGAQIGNTNFVTNSPGNCNSGQVDYAFDQDFPDGLAAYKVGGSNFVAITTSDLTQVAFGTLEVTWTVAYDVELVSGGGQSGAVTGPLDEPLRVRLKTGATNPQYAGKPVIFKLTQFAGSGATLGIDEYATTQTYTAAADAQGFAEAVLVLGSKAGTYTVEATSPNASSADKKVTFTSTAQKPDRVVIGRDQADPASASPTFTVLLLQEPRFYAIGVDAQGGRVGRTKCFWSASAKGKLGGSGTLNPSAVPTSSATFTPTSLGTMTLSANPSVSGLATAKADLLLGGLYVQVDPNSFFDPKAPVDDLLNFVPGSDLAGKSLPVPTPADGTKEIQTLTLHLLTDPGIKGTVVYQLANVSNYPGIAMNWPTSNAGVGKDLDLDRTTHAQSTAGINLDPSGDTKTSLFVYDYGAYGELTATISTGRKNYTVRVTIPATEEHRTGYADAGWDALADAAAQLYDHVPNTGLAGSIDIDSQPASGPVTLNGVTQTLGITGDGLSLYEEYRGFVVRGAHRRLNPARKDLFVRMDAVLQQLDDVFFKLPLTFHYLDDNEVVADAAGLQPLVNPNGQMQGAMTVPGTSPQYALRVRARLVSPILTDNNVIPALVVPAYTTWYGKHFGLNEDLDNVANPDQHLNGSPNETRVCDIFMESFGKSAIFPDANGVLHSTIICSDPAQPGCDVTDTILNAIFPGNDRVLNTPIAAGDHYEEMLRDCNGHEAFYPAEQLEDLKRAVIAHESAHGLNVNHSDFFPSYVPDPCGTLMYSHGNIVPFPTDYLPIDIVQLRLHMKHQ